MLIGSATYQSTELLDLPAVKNNLQDLRAILTDPAAGGLLPQRCTVVADSSDPRAVYHALRQAAAAAEDLLLVYFAGHGCMSPRNDLFLALPGTGLDELAFTAFPYEQLRHVLSESSAAVRAVILDCCFSGNAIPTMGEDGPAASGQFLIEGTYVLTSTPANVQALAPPGERHTAFTGELIQLLSTGVAGGPKLLTFAETYRQLLHATSRRGLPQPRRQGIDNADQLALAQNVAFRRDTEDGPGIETSGSEDAEPSAGPARLTKQRLRKQRVRNRSTEFQLYSIVAALLVIGFTLLLLVNLLTYVPGFAGALHLGTTLDNSAKVTAVIVGCGLLGLGSALIRRPWPVWATVPFVLFGAVAGGLIVGVVATVVWVGVALALS